MKTSYKYTRKRYGAGYWKRGCGNGRARGSHTANGAIGERSSASWYNSTGSFHEWYQGRAGTACLMNMVYDATSTVEARMGDEETIWAAARVLRQWIEKYGVPLALYTDWKNVYVRDPTEKELLHGEVPVTQFGRMCQKLDIRIIAANSPQAKGRVERGNGTHQDRLIKKMGRRKIRTHEAANDFLQQEYLADHNARFAREPALPQDYHRKPPAARELDQVFCLETERSISNDWVVRYENRWFQIERSQRLSAAAGQGDGVRVGRRAHRDSASGQGSLASRDRAVQTGDLHCGEQTAEAFAVEAGSRPPLEGGGAASHCLRCALTARPNGLPGLRSGSGSR